MAATLKPRELSTTSGTNASCFDRAIGADPDQMYRQHYQKVFRYVRSRVASHELAEDLVADIFCRAVAKADGYVAIRETPLPWLYRIAAHRVADHYRRVRPTCSLDSALMVADPGPDPAQVVVRTATVAEMWRFSRLLPATQRRALWLRFGEELDLGEIAVRMNKSVEAVKLLIHRGLRRIRSLAANPGYLPVATRESRLAEGS